MTTSTRSRAVIVCVDCGQHRPVEAKNRCSACYYRDYRRRATLRPPRPSIGLITFAHEYEHFAGFGWSHERIADRLGITRETFDKKLARARAAGLLHEGVNR